MFNLLKQNFFVFVATRCHKVLKVSRMMGEYNNNL